MDFGSSDLKIMRLDMVDSMFWIQKVIILDTPKHMNLTTTKSDHNTRECNVTYSVMYSHCPFVVALMVTHFPSSRFVVTGCLDLPNSIPRIDWTQCLDI